VSVDKVKFTENDDILIAEKPLPLVDIDVKGATAERIVEVETGEEAIERYLTKMRKLRNYSSSNFAYHAFGNRRNNWTPEKARILIDHARENGMEVRAWANDESAINLIVIKDPDMSENSGWDLYQKMEGKFDSYGLASFYEFEQWGVEVYTGEDVEILPLPAPDGTKGIKVAGWGIKIGKGNEWVCLR